MIYLGIGSNLPSTAYGSPAANCRVAIARLQETGFIVLAQSRFYETAPVPRSDQPWFVNCVVGVATDLTPPAALGACLAVEESMGRVRSVRNAARIVDIDVLIWHDLALDAPDLVLPHPRLHRRAFVLLPLSDIAPGWRHPTLGAGIGDLISKLPADQEIRPIKA